MSYDFNVPYETGGMQIPPRMMPGIQRYIEQGIIPGDFLQKVICNDLFGAVAHADGGNLQTLPAYVRFFYNHTPSTCWGGKKEMKAWSEQRGLEKYNG